MKKVLVSYYSVIIQCVVLFLCTYVISCHIYLPFGYYAGKLTGLPLRSDFLMQAIIVGLIVLPIFLYTIWKSGISSLMGKVNPGLATIALLVSLAFLFVIAKYNTRIFFTLVVIPLIMFAFGLLWLISVIGNIKAIALKYIVIKKSEYNKIIEERIKSERFKTELITNVSHDIKTPLTSIINYIDLIKRLDIQNETLIEYINILDKKSDRLKMLINDLIEASKTGTGNVSVNYQEIDLVEITGQVAGEFDTLFENAGLEFVFRHSEEKIKVITDGRHLWRIMENIFSNAIKYSMADTRIYADIKQENDYVFFSLKNISKEKLGISSEELMEQFVRGDRSRHSEGSGLGLYIARSLTELMGGQFEIKVIGDLFEVTVRFKRNMLKS